MIQRPDTWRARWEAGQIRPDDIPELLDTLDAIWLAYAELSRRAWAVREGEWSQGHREVRYLHQVLCEAPVSCACDPPESAGAWCTGHCTGQDSGKVLMKWTRPYAERL